MASQINFKGNIDLIYKIQKFIKAKRICDNVLQQIVVNLIDQKTDIQRISKKGDEYLKQQIEKEMPNKTIEQLIIIPTSIMTYPKEVAYPLDIANIHFGILVDGFPAIVSDTIILKENKLHPNFRKYNGLRNNINQIIGKITELLKPGIRSNYLDIISRKVAQEHGCELIGDTLIYKVHQPFEDVQSVQFRQEEVIKLNETYNLNLCLSFEQTDQNEFTDFQFTDFIRAPSGTHFYSKRQVFLFSATYFILKTGPAKICGFPDTNFMDTKFLYQYFRALHQISNQIAAELFERMQQLIQFSQKRMRKIIETIEVLGRKPLAGKNFNQLNLLFQQVKHQIIRVRESIVQTINKHYVLKIIAQQIKRIVDSFFIQLDILEQDIQVLAQNLDNNNNKEKQEKQKQQSSEIKLKNKKEQNKENLGQTRDWCFTVKKRLEMTQYDIKILEKICSNNINIFNYFAGTQGNPNTGLLNSDFDPKHNRKWNSGRQIIERRGPSYHLYHYYHPMGYFGYALNVKGKYLDDDKWLDRYGDDGEWRILYHGTLHEYLKNIVMEGLIPGRNQTLQSEECELTKKKVGIGVYFSDRVEVCESFARPTLIGGKKYILLFQSRVNPRAIRQSYFMKQLQYFLVNESKDIRTYRILIKEIS